MRIVIEQGGNGNGAEQQGEAGTVALAGESLINGRTTRATDGSTGSLTTLPLFVRRAHF